jgi:hypothetical protein
VWPEDAVWAVVPGTTSLVVGLRAVDRAGNESAQAFVTGEPLCKPVVDAGPPRDAGDGEPPPPADESCGGCSVGVMAVVGIASRRRRGRGARAR